MYVPFSSLCNSDEPLAQSQLLIRGASREAWVKSYIGHLRLTYDPAHALWGVLDGSSMPVELR